MCIRPRPVRLKLCIMQITYLRIVLSIADPESRILLTNLWLVPPSIIPMLYYFILLLYPSLLFYPRLPSSISDTWPAAPRTHFFMQVLIQKTFSGTSPNISATSWLFSCTLGVCFGFRNCVLSVVCSVGCSLFELYFNTSWIKE